MQYYMSSKRRQLPLRWMAPEAVRENKYTHLSDVYSFGVVMYEVFTYAVRGPCWPFNWGLRRKGGGVWRWGMEVEVCVHVEVQHTIR